MEWILNNLSENKNILYWNILLEDIWDTSYEVAVFSEAEQQKGLYSQDYTKIFLHNYETEKDYKHYDDKELRNLKIRCFFEYPYRFYVEDRLEQKKSYGICFLNNVGTEYIRSGISIALDKRLKSDDIMRQFEVIPIKNDDYGGKIVAKNNNEKKIQEIIFCAERLNSWIDTSVYNKLYDFIKRKLNELHKDINNFIIFDIKDLKETEYQELINCNKGISGKALIITAISRIKELLGVGKEPDSYQYMSLAQLLCLEYYIDNFMEKHDRMQLGWGELYRFRKALKTIPAVLPVEGEAEWEKAKEQIRTKEKDLDEILGNRYDDSSFEEANKWREIREHREKLLEQDKKLENKKSWDWEGVDWMTYRFYLHTFIRMQQIDTNEVDEKTRFVGSLAGFAEEMFDVTLHAGETAVSEKLEELLDEVNLSKEDFEELFQD